MFVEIYPQNKPISTAILEAISEAEFTPKKTKRNTIIIKVVMVDAITPPYRAANIMAICLKSIIINSSLSVL